MFRFIIVVFLRITAFGDIESTESSNDVCHNALEIRDWDLYVKCCKVDSDCSPFRACIHSRCHDPCQSTPCGAGATCKTINHKGRCSCPLGTTGNASKSCEVIKSAKAPNDPCNPSPCGPGAICRLGGQRPFCKCETGLYGDPYLRCRAECNVDSDCSPFRACIHSRCHDPCQATPCGAGATCKTINHKGRCSCPLGTTGNASESCKITKSAEPPNDICDYLPCGPGAICRVEGQRPFCECKTDIYGDPHMGCWPECIVDSHCSPSRACIHSRCHDPCQATPCGAGATCKTINHKRRCSCPHGTTGNASESCEVIKSDTTIINEKTLERHHFDIFDISEEDWESVSNSHNIYASNEHWIYVAIGITCAVVFGAMVWLLSKAIKRRTNYTEHIYASVIYDTRDQQPSTPPMPAVATIRENRVSRDSAKYVTMTPGMTPSVAHYLSTQPVASELTKKLRQDIPVSSEYTTMKPVKPTPNLIELEQPNIHVSSDTVRYVNLIQGQSSNALDSPGFDKPQLIYEECKKEF